MSSLTLSEGTLTPTFDSAVLIYTATVAHDVEETTVTATPTDSNATAVVSTFVGPTVTVYMDGTVPLTQGVPISIYVVVTAEDGTTKINYLITVTRPDISPLGHSVPRPWLRAAPWQ